MALLLQWPQLCWTLLAMLLATTALPQASSQGKLRAAPISSEFPKDSGLWSLMQQAGPTQGAASLSSLVPCPIRGLVLYGLGPR